MKKILIIGVAGQVGTEIAEQLIRLHGEAQVIATDINTAVDRSFHIHPLNVMDPKALDKLCLQHRPTQIYHLVSLLSATGEQQPQQAWHLNTQSLWHVLQAACTHKVAQVFWPSSIAVFGENTPPKQTPQYCYVDPLTMYGISKLAGERLCAYFYYKYQLDVRSLRYPGLISYKAPPGGGTTDYAIDMYKSFLLQQDYTCFLQENTSLPMMYMPDAIRATLTLMDAPSHALSVRNSYNLTAFSMSPREQAKILQNIHAAFKVHYAPDFRQNIASTWPESIDDSQAQQDWGWQPSYTLESMTKDILQELPAYL